MDLFRNYENQRRPALRAVQFKVRRLVYQKLVEMARWPNYEGARILAFCLNVFGLTISREVHRGTDRALHIVVLSWTKKHFARIYAYDSKLAAACLVEGYTYEPEKLRLVHTYVTGMTRRPVVRYFAVDPPPPGSAPDYSD
jgi:hypothetical protein